MFIALKIDWAQNRLVNRRSSLMTVIKSYLSVAVHVTNLDSDTQDCHLAVMEISKRASAVA